MEAYQGIQLVGTHFPIVGPILNAAVMFPFDSLDRTAGPRYCFMERVLVLVGIVHTVVGFPLKAEGSGATSSVTHSQILETCKYENYSAPH